MSDLILRLLLQSNWIVGLFLALGFLSFLYAYCRPAYQLGAKLKECRKALQETHSQRSGLSGEELRDRLGRIFAKTPMSGLWSEYLETLHLQEHEGRGRRYRATVQAGQILTVQSVVESPLKVEFFKHLPGILTGLGIIGTFCGLIKGLMPLETGNALSDPATTQILVGALLKDVGEAFVVSASAIGLAMVVTVFEKAWYNSLLKALEGVCEAVDELFQLGVGEEYLSQLVRAAEGTYVKTQQLKDSLVDDLKSMMENLTAAQISAMERNNLALGEAISGSIQRTFQEPLDHISKTVQAASGDQSKNVEGMLGSLLTTFMERLDGSFGNQFKGMESLMSELSNTLENTRKTMEETLLQLRQASTQGVQEMGESFHSIQVHAAQQQAEMREAFQSFMRKQNDEQSTSIRTMISELQTGQKSVIEALSSQGQRIGEASAQAVTQMGGEVTKVTSGLDQAVSRIEQAIKALQEHSIKVGETNLMAIEGLNTGAENLRRAAAGLSGSWKETETSIKESREATTLLKQSSENLGQSARELRIERGEERIVLQDIQRILEDARAITVLSSTAREGLNTIVTELSNATEEYIQKVPGSLATNFEQFTNGVVQGINRSQKELNLIWTDVISEFKQVLSEFNDVLERAERDRKNGQR